MATITFHELLPVPWFRQRRLVKTSLIDMFKKEQTDLATIDFIFCSDDYLLSINQQFLQHDDYTDIISFDLTDEVLGFNGKLKERGPVKGEIYISIERVLDNARHLKIKREDELRRVIIHGCLHLCGYKDKLNEQKAIMRKMEDKYLRLYLKRST